MIILTPKEVRVLEILNSDKSRWWFGNDLIKIDPQLTRGTVYVLLNNLEHSGLAQSKKMSDRKYAQTGYRITETGTREYIQWQEKKAQKNASVNPLLPVAT